MIMKASNERVRSEVSHFGSGRKFNVNFIDIKLKTEKASSYNSSCKHNGYKIRRYYIGGKFLHDVLEEKGCGKRGGEA